MLTLACTVTITLNSLTTSFQFPTYRQASRFAVEVIEANQEAHAVTKCDPIAEKEWINAHKRKKTNTGR